VAHFAIVEPYAPLPPLTCRDKLGILAYHCVNPSPDSLIL
jgi:hypothetical protein